MKRVLRMSPQRKKDGIDVQGGHYLAGQAAVLKDCKHKRAGRATSRYTQLRDLRVRVSGLASLPTRDGQSRLLVVISYKKMLQKHVANYVGKPFSQQEASCCKYDSFHLGSSSSIFGTVATRVERFSVNLGFQPLHYRFRRSYSAANRLH